MQWRLLPQQQRSPNRRGIPFSTLSSAMRSFYRATPVGPTVGSGVPPARRPRNRQTGDSIAVLESWSQRRDRALRPRPPSGRLRPCLTRPAPVGAGRWRRSLLGGRRRSFGAPDGRGDEQRRRRVPLGRWLRFAQSPCTSHPALRARRSSVTPKRVLGRRELRVSAAPERRCHARGRAVGGGPNRTLQQTGADARS